MDEDIQYMANMSYTEELESSQDANVIDLMMMGIPEDEISDVYSTYAVNKTPTFSTSPEENETLGNFTKVAEVLKNPALREDEELNTLYLDYLDYKAENTMASNGFILKGASMLGKAIKGTGVLQRADSPFKIRKDNLDQDSAKAYDWLESMESNNDPEMSSWFRALDTTTAVAGIIVDTVSLQQSLGGDAKTVLKAVRTGNAAKADSLIGRAMAEKFIAKTSIDGANLTKGFLTTARFSAQLAEDVAIGSSYALLESIKDGGDIRPNEIVKDFGVGVGSDLIINTISSIAIPSAKIGGRIFFKANKGAFTKGSMKTIDDAVDAGLDAIQGKVNKNLLKQMRREGLYSSADALEEVQGEMIKVKTLKDAGLNQDAMMKVYALSTNMKLNKVNGQYELVENILTKSNKVKTKTTKVATLEEVANIIDKKQLQGLKRNLLQSASAASMTKDLKVTQVMETTLKSKDAKINLVDFGNAVVPKSGAFNVASRDQAFKGAKAAIKELGAGEVGDLAHLDAKLSDNFFKSLPNHQSPTLELPRQINSATELKQYTEYLGKYITHHGNDIDEKALGEVLETFSKSTGSWSLRDMDWINTQAAKDGSRILVQDGAYYIDDGVETLAFDSQELLGNHVFAKTISDDYYQDFLQIEKNFTMARDEDGLLRVYNQAKSPIAEGNSVEEIMANNAHLRPKYPIETGPKFNFVTDSTRQVKFNGDYIEGSVDQINKYFDNYANTKIMADLRDSRPVVQLNKGNGKKVFANVDKRYYMVTADAYGMTPKKFKTEKALKKFLAEIDTPQKTALRVAGEKGVNIIADKAGFIVQKVGKEDQAFKSFDEASEYVAKLPNKPVTPEMLEAAEKDIRVNNELYGKAFEDVNLEGYSDDQNVALLKSALDATQKSNKESFIKRKLGGETRALFNKFRGSRGQVYSMMKGNADALPVAKAFDGLLETEKQMKVINTRFGAAMAGLEKLTTKKERAHLGELLSKELPEHLWNERYTAMTGEALTENQTKFLKGIRSMFDQAGELNGFGDSLDRIENYFTRMKTLEPSRLFSGKETSVSLMESVYGRDLTTAEKKFYENMRTIDLASYAFDSDPLSLVQRYVDDTMKSNLLNPAIDNLIEAGEKNLTDMHDKNTITKIARHARGLSEDEMTERLKSASSEIALSLYQKTANGYAKAHGLGKNSNQVKAFMQGKMEAVSTESIAKMSEVEQEVFAKAIQKNNLRQNPLNKVFGAVTLGTQAFKPWLPIRNTFQAETHLAPIFGLDAIVQAKKQVSEMSDEAYEYLANSGIFQTKSILSEVGLTGTGKIAKLNEIGLMSYKASDDFDRAVGFTVIRNRLSEALEASTDFGRQSGDYFVQHTKLYAAPKHIRDGVLDSIAKSDLEDATVQYAQWMNDMTFLNYSSINRPEAFNSLFGKMFGQMGTFSTQTFESRKYFLQNLTKADAASYTARAVLGGFALNSAWSEITGTEVNNFSPVQSMIFGGGPTIDTIIATRDLISGQDYKQKQGLATLKNQAKNVYSPFKTVQNLYEGFDKVLEGDSVPGIQQLLSLPGKGEGDYDDPTAVDIFKRAF